MKNIVFFGYTVVPFCALQVNDLAQFVAEFYVKSEREPEVFRFILKGLISSKTTIFIKIMKTHYLNECSNWVQVFEVLDNIFDIFVVTFHKNSGVRLVKSNWKKSSKLRFTILLSFQCYSPVIYTFAVPIVRSEVLKKPWKIIVFSSKNVTNYIIYLQLCSFSCHSNFFKKEIGFSTQRTSSTNDGYKIFVGDFNDLDELRENRMFVDRDHRNDRPNFRNGLSGRNAGTSPWWKKNIFLQPTFSVKNTTTLTFSKNLVNVLF